jgi:hypothetical protein
MNTNIEKITNIPKHIEIIDSVSKRSYELLQCKQDVILIFVYCSIQKLNKINSVIKGLYPNMNSQNDIEFSLGILIRSLLMDCILVNNLSWIIEKETEKAKESGFTQEIKEKIQIELEKKCKIFLADGLDFVVNSINKETNIDVDKKEKLIEGLLNEFPEVQKDKKIPNKYIKPKDYIFSLSILHNISKSDKAPYRESMYFLYDYYSKYDHLSNLTSQFQNFVPFEKRKNYLDSAIYLLIMQLRTTLYVGLHYGKKECLKECLKECFTEIDNYLQNMNQDKK